MSASEVPAQSICHDVRHEATVDGLGHSARHDSVLGEVRDVQLG